MAQKNNKNNLFMQKSVLLLSLPILLSMKCTDDNLKNPNGELHILPKNYIGRVVILFNQKDGNDKTVVNGKKVYNIPDCGYLKTKFPRPTGQLGIPESQYFTYVYSNGDTIPFLSNTSEIDSSMLNKVFAFSHTLGEYGFSETENYELVEYFVDTLKNMDKYKVFGLNKKDLDKCK